MTSHLPQRGVLPPSRGYNTGAGDATERWGARRNFMMAQQMERRRGSESRTVCQEVSRILQLMTGDVARRILRSFYSA